MGTWGTALYSNDTASDVRDLCKEIYPLVSSEDAQNIIFEEYAELLETDTIDNEYASFWYALADQQWQRGILSETVRSKAIELLTIHAGIENWTESASKRDLEKRIRVLDTLLEKLKSPQPAVKISKKRLAKPKHKPGDIIIFQSCGLDEDPEHNVWNIDKCTLPLFFCDPVIAGAPDVLSPPFDAHGKYMALLCVGSEKVEHSAYVQGFEDEYSIYAFYNYAADEKPTLEALRHCGFLPAFLRYLKDFNKGITEFMGWTYTMNFYGIAFSPRCDAIAQLEVLKGTNEEQRFHQLFSQKNYLSQTTMVFSLHEAFSSFFDEKARLETLGMQIDDLLDADSRNPELVSIEEADIALKEWSKERTAEFLQAMKDRQTI